MYTSKTRNSHGGWLGRLACLALAISVGADAAQTLVPAGSIWKYLSDGSDQGTAWSQPGFNDSAWQSGPAPLGFGDSHIVTSLPSGFITYYFRQTFTVADASAISALTLRVLRDDGAVVYLNGVEVYRSNLPTGPIGFTTLALTAVGGPDETTYFQASVANLLVNGANTIAGEVHQASLGSSDVGFDLDLVGDAGTTDQPPVANSQNVTVQKNGSVAIILTGSDPDGTVPFFEIVDAPANGTLSGSPPTVTYTPALDYVGSDSFT